MVPYQKHEEEYWFFPRGEALNPSTEFTHSDARIVSFGRLRNTARAWTIENLALK